MARRLPVLALGGCLAVLAPAPALAAEAANAGRVRVFYDGEPCDGDAIDIEVFDRAAEVWVPHPDHPRVPVRSCREEEPGRLLNELRWRCATPEGVAPWRNFQVFRPGVFSRCANEEILEQERQRIRAAQRKRLELKPEVGEAEAPKRD